ncbi:hemin uptake protein HemP [Mesorhizobium sp. SB112]|uniref:hemin uptake protein HemP n=1 Tax=Mesorhizobium sp. SB112 TaxID=3151853 RepID=UPI003263A4CB
MNTHNPHHFHMRPRRTAETTVVRTDFARPVTRTVASDTLFRGDHEIGIEHHGALYRLKITRQGKLILNK